MGVHGLWQLLDPLGCRVSLESLENKVLAIDASIWIHQAVRGMRDKNGNPVHNAHLVGAFNRLCKLLFYRIKPIFVFDGTVPLLKRETMASRRERQSDAMRDAEKSRKQILQKHLKLIAISETLKSKDATDSGIKPVKNNPSKLSSIISASGDKDLYELPPVPPSTSFPHLSTASDDSDDADAQLLSVSKSVAFQDISKVDVDSDVFKSLPLELQHELLVELLEYLRRVSWTRLSQLPHDSEEIGQHQIKQLLHRRKIQKRLENVSKLLKSSYTEALYDDLEDHLADNSSIRMAEIKRIVSEDSSHYIFYKKVKQMCSDSQPLEMSQQYSSQEIVGSSLDSEDFSLHSENKQGTSFERPISVRKTVKSVGGVGDDPSCSTADFSPEEVLISDDSFDSSSEQHSEVNGHNLLVKNNDAVIDKLKIDASVKKHECFDVSTQSENNVSNYENKSSTKEDNTCDILLANIKETSANYLEPFKKNEQNMSNSSFNSDYLELEPKSKERVQNAKSDATDIISDEDDSDFVEVKSLPGSPTNVELFPPQVFEESNYELSFNEHECDVLSSVSSVNEISVSRTEDLIELSEHLEDEVNALVQDKGRHERVAATITDQMYSEIQELLKLFGVPFVISPAEAEAQCATMDILDLTEGTITDDSDIWLFGGRRVYKNFFNQNREVLYFKDLDIQKRLGLDRRKLIAVALLTGSDYTEGIKGVGVVSALELLAEFVDDDGVQSLHTFCDWWKKAKIQKFVTNETKTKKSLRSLTLRDGFPSSIVVDAYMNPTVDSSREPFTWALPDLDELRRFASNKMGWTKKKLDGILLPVIKKMNAKGRQTHLSDFFSQVTNCNKSEAADSRTNQHSRRIQRAVKRVLSVKVDSTKAKTKKTSLLSLKRTSCSRVAKKKGLTHSTVSQATATMIDLSESSSTSSDDNYTP